MKKKVSKTFYNLYGKTTLNIIFAITLSIFFLTWSFHRRITTNSVEQLTDTWINYVTVQHDSQKAADLFCENGSLIGTVSQIKRTGNDIKSYFDFFVNLPGIKVFEKKYEITRISNDVYINTAFVTWYWNTLDKPVVARMTFVIKNNCIFQLHSSVMPDVNKDLVSISNKK
jgi:hypothetical protein